MDYTLSLSPHTYPKTVYQGYIVQCNVIVEIPGIGKLLLVVPHECVNVPIFAFLHFVDHILVTQILLFAERLHLLRLNPLDFMYVSLVFNHKC